MKQFSAVLFLMFVGALAHAQDAELDAEQAINDSEASHQLASETKQRVAHDKREAVARETEAARLAMKADFKQKLSNDELARNEAELKKLGERIRAAKAKSSAAEKVIAKMDAALAAKQIQLTSAREQLKFATEEGVKRDHRIGELKDKSGSAQRDLASTTKDIQDARAKFKQRAKDEALEQTRLDQMTKQSAAAQTATQQEIERLKSTYQKQKSETDAHKAKLGAQREREKQTAENLAWAKQQTANQKSRSVATDR